MLVLAATLYARSGARWWLFAALFLVPDLGMLGYMRDPKLGAWLYNAVHNYVVPAVLVGLSWHRWELGYTLGLIWAAHIGLDRMLGYGLKYRSAFRHTHLGFPGASV